MPQRTKRRLALFVHGFGSSPAAWDKLLELLRADPEVHNEFELDCHGYPSQRFEFNFLRGLPSLQQVGRDLAKALERRRFDYDEITLVGHSQGGLVIHAALLELLHSTSGDPTLERIRQVITIATPHLGSTTLSRTRKLLSHFYFFNQQERTLRVLNEEIDQMRRHIEQKVVQTDQRSAETWPIPVSCFYGLRDGVVPEASARGPFPYAEALDGDHSTVLEPTGQGDDGYRKIRDALLVPSGHPRIWEVDRYDLLVRVEPNPTPQRTFTLGARQKAVYSDSIGHVTRQVTFSRKNTCAEPFEIRYRTRSDGFIKVATSTDNEVEPGRLATYQDYGTEYTYKFTPRAGDRFWLNIEVYKGFEDGQRDIHFHLGRKCIYREFIVRLDLQTYLDAGYRVTREPRLYYHGRDPGDHAMCESRESGRAVICTSQQQNGVWEWRLSGLRDGVVDLVWDVTGGAGLPRDAAHHPGVQLT